MSSEGVATRKSTGKGKAAGKGAGTHKPSARGKRKNAAVHMENQKGYDEQKQLRDVGLAALSNLADPAPSSAHAAGDLTDPIPSNNDDDAKSLGTSAPRDGAGNDDIDKAASPENEDMRDQEEQKIACKKAKVMINSTLSEEERLVILREFLTDSGLPLEVAVALGSTADDLRSVVTGLHQRQRADFHARGCDPDPGRAELRLSDERRQAATAELQKLPLHYHASMTVRSEAALGKYARLLFLRIRNIPQAQRSIIDSFLSCISPTLWDHFRKTWNGLRSELHKKHKKLATFLAQALPQGPTRDQVKGYLQGSLSLGASEGSQHPNTVQRLWSPMSHVDPTQPVHAEVSCDMVMLCLAGGAGGFDWAAVHSYDARTQSLRWP